MYDRIIDKLVEVLVSGLFSFFSGAYSDFTRIRNIEAALQSLAETRTRIDALLLDARRARRHLPSSFLLWLHNLHSISLDAQDLIEEHAALASCSLRKRKRAPSFLLNKSFSDRIQKLKARYDLIYDDRKKLKLDSGESSSRLRDVNYQESAVLDHAHHLFGRNTERSEIVGLLVNDTDYMDLPVYSIVGCGGIGKTSVARPVFEDENVRGFFDLMVWVGLDGEVGVVETMRKIVEAVEKVECRLSSFDLMLWRVRERVMKKKVLVVMDNVWSEEMDYWDKLRVALVGSGAGGSKFLVTTRSERVSRNMRAVRPWHLEGLPRDHCWSIFCERAFARGEGSKVLEENPELETIGLEIIDKCHGLPLLVKSIASLLFGD